MKLKRFFAEKGKENQTLSQGRGQKGLPMLANLIEKVDTREELAKIAGVSHDTVHKVQTIENAKLPEEITGKLYGEKHSQKDFQNSGNPLKIVKTDKELAKIAGGGDKKSKEYKG